MYDVKAQSVPKKRRKAKDYRKIVISVKYEGGSTPGPEINGTNDAVSVLRELFNKKTMMWVEECMMLCLNGAGVLMSWFPIATGGCSSCIMDVRVICTVAAQAGARQIIISHNHPSGTLFPSANDITSTVAIKNGLEAIGVHLRDHVILTEQSHFSMRDAGFFK